jgi:hypothetical protein
MKEETWNSFLYLMVPILLHADSITRVPYILYYLVTMHTAAPEAVKRL